MDLDCASAEPFDSFISSSKDAAAPNLSPCFTADRREPWRPIESHRR
jgi:hypothetical protein